ncbi:MFS transporter [Levilactobacillus brevis]|uniref:hypothetical protein n=1 Tax=Levilactobacillus brevis TaxID=1580 RepID=UPI001CDADE94|nr:hypothetical protein [Levilactobacillus brevis]
MLTLISALTAQLSHADSRLFNLLYIFINLGLVVGTASIGFLFHHSLRPIFGLLLICYGGAIGLWHWRAGTYEQQSEIPVTVRDKSAEATATLPFSPLMIVGLLVSLVLMWLTYAQWMSNVSVYIQAEGLGIKLYSYLWVYNGVLLMVVQALMARFSQPRFLMRQIMGGYWRLAGLSYS